MVSMNNILFKIFYRCRVWGYAKVAEYEML